MNLIYRKTILLLIIAILVTACSKKQIDYQYRDQMRNFVATISKYSKTMHPGFIIIPQNGHELIVNNGEGEKSLHFDYLGNIDGAGQEDLFYGYDADNRKTPGADTEYLLEYLNICEENKIKVLVTDYCSDEEKVSDSYSQNNQMGFISFAAPDRELRVIPKNGYIYNENNEDIPELADAKNFLYLINSENFSTKSDFIESIANTNYDLIIMDLYFNDQILEKEDIVQLKTKKNGSSRLLVCYLSIGEAEDYRFYWNEAWSDTPPSWLGSENKEWKGNYHVNYWDPEWQSIILGSEESYLDRILSAGFDGVYLDIIEAFEYFE